MPHSTTYNEAVRLAEQRAWERKHRSTVAACVMFRHLASLTPAARYVYPEPVSAYPALDDLPCDGWVWYDESAGQSASE